MSKTFLIAGHEYLTNVRRRGFIITTLIVPVVGLIALIVGSFFTDQATSFFASQVEGPQQVGVVDNAGLFMPILPDYTEQFQAFDSEEAGREALRAEEIGALLTIPPDYLETGTVQMVSRTERPMERANLRNVEAFFQAHLLQDRIDPALQARVLEPYTLVTTTLEGTGDGEAQDAAQFLVGFFVSYGFGLLLVISIFFSSGYLLRSVAEEKESRIMEILVSSVRPEQLLAGKVLGLGGLGLTQVLVWVTSAVTLSMVGVEVIGLPATSFATLLDNPDVLVLGLVYYVLGFLVFAVLMGGVGSLGSSMQESQQIAGIFTAFAVIPLVLAGFIVSSPNSIFARALSYFPLTSPTTMLLRVPLAEVPLLDILISVGVLVLSIPLVLWAGTKVFRTGMLLYGQKPGVRQIFEILRRA